MTIDLSKLPKLSQEAVTYLVIALLAFAGGHYVGEHGLPNIGGIIAPATGPRAFLVVHEAGDADADFAAVKVLLRKDDFAEPLAAKGHTLQILDKDHLTAQWHGKAEGVTLPALVVAAGDKVLAREPLPKKFPDVKALIEKHGGPLQ